MGDFRGAPPSCYIPGRGSRRSVLPSNRRPAQTMATPSPTTPTSTDCARWPTSTFLGRGPARSASRDRVVLNHTSDRHPWFKPRAWPRGRVDGTYVWSDTIERYREARIIFRIRPSKMVVGPGPVILLAPLTSIRTDPLENRPCHERAGRGRFWFAGVEGCAWTPCLPRRGEGTNCENLPQTHPSEKLRAARRSALSGPHAVPGNQWGRTRRYFAAGTMPMNFHSHHARMFMAIHVEIASRSWHPGQTSANPPNCSWRCSCATRRLTIEMVTGRGRGLQYPPYAATARCA